MTIKELKEKQLREFEDISSVDDDGYAIQAFWKQKQYFEKSQQEILDWARGEIEKQNEGWEEGEFEAIKDLTTIF